MGVFIIAFDLVLCEHYNTTAKSDHFSRTVGRNTVAKLLKWKVDPRLESLPDISYTIWMHEQIESVTA